MYINIVIDKLFPLEAKINNEFFEIYHPYIQTSTICTIGKIILEALLTHLIILEAQNQLVEASPY